MFDGDGDGVHVVHLFMKCTSPVPCAQRRAIHARHYADSMGPDPMSLLQWAPMVGAMVREPLFGNPPEVAWVRVTMRDGRNCHQPDDSDEVNPHARDRIVRPFRILCRSAHQGSVSVCTGCVVV
jgi:hypothetical protein